MLGKKLLVEGSTDKYFIASLLNNLPSFSQSFTIEPFDKDNQKGIQALLSSLPISLKGADPDDILGVVVDADLSVSGRLQRITQILEQSGYQLTHPLLTVDGCIVPSDGLLPRFGLWIMPNNQEQGVLENFMRLLIHEHDKLQPIVDQALIELKGKELQLFSDVKRPKAFIKTWLAWQENPEISYGTAIAKRLFLTDTHLCSQFISWLDRLFNTQ